jgi:hypothetical protein
MTPAPIPAGQSSDDGLTARIFRAFYPEFDLRAINGTYIVVPKGTRWLAGQSLGAIARQLSDQDRPEPTAYPGLTRKIVASTASTRSPAAF